MPTFDKHNCDFCRNLASQYKVSTLIMRLLFVVFLGLLSQVSFAQDNAKAIVVAINQSNARDITQFFNDDTDITVLDEDESGDTGMVLISKFFSVNKTTSFSVKHEGTSKLGNTYIIGDLTTNTGKFRVTFFTKATDSEIEVIQFKIEKI